MSNNYSQQDFIPSKVIDTSQVINSANTPIDIQSTSGSYTFFSFLRYILIFIVVFFLISSILNSIFDTNLTIGNIIDKFLKFIGISAGEITKQTVDTSTKGLIDVAESVKKGTDSAVNILEGRVDNKEPSKYKVNNSDKKLFKKAFNHAKNNQENLPEGDENTSSRINRERGQPGYCYIGEQRGIRSCVEIGINDTCMSGDIFPTNDICINPKLRLGADSSEENNSTDSLERNPKYGPIGCLLNDGSNEDNNQIYASENDTGIIPSEKGYIENMQNKLIEKNVNIR